MDVCKKNIFLTGAPSSGKTTVIKKIVRKLDFPACGFYTEEERLDGRRVGFMLKDSCVFPLLAQLIHKFSELSRIEVFSS